MAYEYRRPIFNLSGTLTTGCTALDTVLSSTIFADLPADYTDRLYLPLVLANDTQGKAEVVWVVGHAAGAASVTVVRGREGTTPQPFAAGDVVRCSPTPRSTGEICVANRAALPADAHYGLRVVILNEGQVVERTSAGWNDSAPLEGDAARKHLWFQTNAGLALSQNGVVANGMGPASPNGTIATFINGVLRFNQAGLWTLSWSANTDHNATGWIAAWLAQGAGGPFLALPYQKLGRSPGSLAGAGALSNWVNWTGYVRSDQASAAITPMVGQNNVNGTAITGASYYLAVEYLGA